MLRERKMNERIERDLGYEDKIIVSLIKIEIKGP